MKALILTVLLLFPQSQGCLNLDVVLVVDTSASVFNSQGFINKAISTFQKRFKGTEANVGVVVFNEGAWLPIQLGDTTTIAVFPCCSTNLLEGLNLATDELNGPRARKDYRKLIIIISDGMVDYPEKCSHMISFMKTMGIGILGVQIGNVHPFMKNNCDVYVESNYEQLAEDLLKMDICS